MFLSKDPESIFLASARNYCSEIYISQMEINNQVVVILQSYVICLITIVLNAAEELPGVWSYVEPSGGTSWQKPERIVLATNKTSSALGQDSSP